MTTQFTHRGMTVTACYKGAYGRPCQTIQGWRFKDPTASRGIGWARSQSAARERIDQMIEWHNMGRPRFAWMAQAGAEVNKPQALYIRVLRHSERQKQDVLEAQKQAAEDWMRRLQQAAPMLRSLLDEASEHLNESAPPALRTMITETLKGLDK